MTVKEFIRLYQPCAAGTLWLKKTFKQTDNAAKIWDVLVTEASKDCPKYTHQEWLMWLLSQSGLYCNQEYWKYTFELIEKLRDKYDRVVLRSVSPELQQVYFELKKLVQTSEDEKEYKKLVACTWKFTQNPMHYSDVLLASIIGCTGYTAFVKVLTNLRITYEVDHSTCLLFAFLRDTLHNPFFEIAAKKKFSEAVTRFAAKKIRLKPKWRTKRSASLPSL